MPKDLQQSVFLLIIALLTSAISTVSLAYSTPLSEDNWNVLIITMDTTRADHIGCYGYKEARTPNIDSIAARGVRFAKAYTPAPLTLPAHCSIFTGKYPFAHHIRNNGSYHLTPDQKTLARILKENGFAATSAFVASFTLDSRFGLAQGFDVYDDTFKTQEVLKTYRSERTADKVVSSFLNWLQANSQKRFFSWVHFYDPHLPYTPPAPFSEEFKKHPYDGEIAFMDSEIGRLISGLKNAGLMDRTIIILAGDHGEALGEKREIDHGLFIYESTLRVPLIVYGPLLPSPGTVVESRVRLIDILPTVLELLKIKPPKDISGQSLLPYIRRRQKADLQSYAESYFPRENFGWSELIGLIDGQWKFIRAPEPELYDLASDPHEEKNIINEQAKLAQSLNKKLLDVVAKIEADRPNPQHQLTREEEMKLRSLGYLGGKSERQASAGALPDPKDKIENYILYFQGNLYETRGEFDRAEACYRQVLALDPDVPWNYINLGVLLGKANRLNEAIQTLKEGRQKFPDSITILTHLMAAYLRAGQTIEALAAGQEVLVNDPTNFDALYIVGDIFARQQKWAEAVSYFERALQIEPENKTLLEFYKQALTHTQKSPSR